MTRTQGIIALLIGAIIMTETGVVVHQHDQQDLGRSEQQSVQERQRLLQRITELESDLATERQVNDDLQAQLLRAAERDRTAKVRASRSRRATALVPLPWAHSRHGIQIANCESADLPHWPWSDGSAYLGGEKGIHLHDQATYTGKWQIGPNEWRDWGGLKYAARPWQANEVEQDIVAEEGYRRRGEQPWACSRKV